MPTLLTVPAGVQCIPWSQYFDNVGVYTLLRWDPVNDVYVPAEADDPAVSDLCTVALAAGRRAPRKLRPAPMKWQQPDHEDPTAWERYLIEAGTETEGL
jgi:hypothetical protein